MSLHLKRPVGRRTELLPAFDDRANRKQRFLVYTAVSTKSWQGNSSEVDPFEMNNFLKFSSFSPALEILEHI